MNSKKFRQAAEDADMVGAKAIGILQALAGCPATMTIEGVLPSICKIVAEYEECRARLSAARHEQEQAA